MTPQLTPHMLMTFARRLRIPISDFLRLARISDDDYKLYLDKTLPITSDLDHVWWARKKYLSNLLQKSLEVSKISPQELSKVFSRWMGRTWDNSEKPIQAWLDLKIPIAPDDAEENYIQQFAVSHGVELFTRADIYFERSAEDDQIEELKQKVTELQDRVAKMEALVEELLGTRKSWENSGILDFLTEPANAKPIVQAGCKIL